MGRSKVPSEARIFSLVLALVASAEGLTKHALLSSVYGYADRYRDESQRVALDRQFERDKVQLRSLGIPVETLESPGEPGNNQLARYRISKDALDVPPGLKFSDRELMLLRMATLAWREGSLTQEARRAAMKLESLGVGIDAPSLGVNAGFGTSEPAAPALLAAIDQGAPVRFLYQLPGREVPLERRVRPLQLHRFEGRWHLISYDVDRAAPRVFLLSRIVGSVTEETDSGGAPESSSAAPFDPAAVETMISETVVQLQNLQRTQRVAVRVARHSAAEAQLIRRADAEYEHEGTDGIDGEADGAGARVIRFGTTDLHELATLVAGFGADAEALEPTTLRDSVTTILRKMLVTHAGAHTHRSETSGSAR